MLAGACLVALGCGGAGVAARAVRPDAPTAGSALGVGACPNDPLIVDFPSDRRAAIEGALRHNGAVLVSYDCHKLEVLTGCATSGGYRYEPVTLKEDVVRMRDNDSVRATLPTLGGAVPASLDAELARGNTLDLALITRGRYVGRDMVSADSLGPACRTASHFVRAVTAGAFAMSVGSQAKARAVAEIFQAGTRGESSSYAAHETKDGDLQACRDANASDGCRAPLRLELRPIDPRSEHRIACEDNGDESACRDWTSLVLSRGEPDPAEARAALAKLDEQCRKGDGSACSEAVFKASKVPNHGFDDHRWLEEGCRLRASGLCALLGQNLEKQGRWDDAYNAYRRACMQQPADCWIMGDILEASVARDPRLKQELADYRARGCRGFSTDCDKYAALYKEGLRANVAFASDPATIKECEAPAPKLEPSGCIFAAASYAFGLGVPRDPTRARKLYALECQWQRRRNPNETCAYPKDWE
jgi:hypothetical protein